MRVTRITPNLHVPHVAEAKSFYAEFLGLREEDMGLDWVARFIAADSDQHLQLVSRDASAPVDSVLTVKVDDVEAAYFEAGACGFEIVHPLTTEPWGVRRFFVRAPDGNVFNIAQEHSG